MNHCTRITNIRMPTVSVVIPTYNRSDTLERAVDSVLFQDYEDFEVFVVDDASTDDTESVMEQYDDPRLTYIRHTENQGGSAARNTGIEKASGKYIALLDSDDEWLKGKLPAQVSCLNSLSNDWVATYCDTTKQRKELNGKVRGILNRLFHNYQGAEGGEELIEYILKLRFGIGAGSTLMIRANTVNKMGGFDESFERHQDWEFLIRLLKQGKLAYIDKELTQLHGTGPPDPETLESMKKHFFQKFSEDIEEYESRGIRVRDYHHLHLARNYYSAGEFTRGTKYFTSGYVIDFKLYASIIWSILSGIKTKW